MVEALQVKITGEVPEGADTRPVRARITPEAAEDVQGQGYKGWLGRTEEDVEGQAAKGWLGQAEEDVQGHGIRGGFLKPVETGDTEGQSYRWNFTPVPLEDAEGNVLRSHVLEIDRDQNGELTGRYVPADDDAEGHALRWGG